MTLDGSEGIPIEHAMSAILKRLIELRDSAGDGADVSIPRPLFEDLLYAAVMLAASSDFAKRDRAKLEAEDSEAWDTLRAAGTAEERIRRAATVKGWLRPDGTLAVKVPRGRAKGPAQRREAVLWRYLGLIRLQGMTATQAADVIQGEFGFGSRSAVRGFLYRADGEIGADPDAVERRFLAPLLDDAGADTPWPRAPHIPIPPE